MSDTQAILTALGWIATLLIQIIVLHIQAQMQERFNKLNESVARAREARSYTIPDKLERLHAIEDWIHDGDDLVRRRMEHRAIATADPQPDDIGRWEQQQADDSAAIRDWTKLMPTHYLQASQLDPLRFADSGWEFAGKSIPRDLPHIIADMEFALTHTDPKDFKAVDNLFTHMTALNYQAVESLARVRQHIVEHG